MSNNKNQNDFPLYLFYQGKNYEAYKFFGVHSKKKRRNLMQASATISTKNWDHIQ